MAKIAIDWGAYDLKEKAFEQELAEGNATLLDHPLPNGGVLARATDEQVALAARQFEQRGQDLLAIAEWLLGKRATPTHVTIPSKLGRLLAVLERAKQSDDESIDRRREPIGRVGYDASPPRRLRLEEQDVR